jgi:hypothetical protein
MLCKSKCIDPSRPEGRLRMTSISLDLRGAKAPLYTTPQARFLAALEMTRRGLLGSCPQIRRTHEMSS